MNRSPLPVPALALPTLLASLLLGPALRQAAADVSLQGGSPAQREALRRVYDRRIPVAFHTGDTLPVRLLTDRRMDAAAREDADGGDENVKDVDGLYDEDTGLIQIRESLPLADLAETFAHEYGHYIWQTLSFTQRRRYGQIYDAQRASGHLVSEYAGTDRAEGFAEAFAYLVTDPPALDRRDPASEAFLQGLPAARGSARPASGTAPAPVGGTQDAHTPNARPGADASDGNGRGWGQNDRGDGH